jgi:hypothetical protein
MLLLFSWRRRAWKESCSLDCFYNGTAAAACLTGLTRLTDTSAAANIWRDCWGKKAVLSPSAAAAPAIQMKMQCNCGCGICVLFSLLLLLQEKACAAQEEEEDEVEDKEEEKAAAVDKEKKNKKPQINLTFRKNKK